MLQASMRVIMRRKEKWGEEKSGAKRKVRRREKRGLGAGCFG
jgi:hypothetical protein